MRDLNFGAVNIHVTLIYPSQLYWTWKVILNFSASLNAEVVNNKFTVRIRRFIQKWTVYPNRGFHYYYNKIKSVVWDQNS